MVCTLSIYVGPLAKPSRIPTPESSSRPLPPLGYVAESLSLHRSPRQRPPELEAPPTSHSPYGTRPTKTITVEIHGIASSNKPSKASRSERATHFVVGKRDRHSNSDNRKKAFTKVTIGKDRHGATAKQTKAHTTRKKCNSWGNGGRLNELRIRLDDIH